MNKLKLRSFIISLIISFIGLSVMYWIIGDLLKAFYCALAAGVERFLIIEIESKNKK